MEIFKIKKDINILRKADKDFIAVSNKEWYSLFKDEIRNSIAIEGVFANRKELLDVLEKNKRADSEKTAAILGYFEAASNMYEYAHNQYKENEFVLRISDIKQIHTILMKYEKEVGTYNGDLGEFRRGDIEVAQATFKPIDAFYVREAMKSFVKWVNMKLDDKAADYSTLSAASHVWFETIHPFRDGNGRVGRILLSYILIGSGFVNIAIKGISKDDREKYYNALERYDECFEKIHKFIEKGEKLSTKDIEGYLQGVDFLKFKDMIINRLEEAVKRLKHSRDVSFKQDAVISLRDLAWAFNYSQDYLRNLINRGNLKAHKRGKLWHVRVRDMQKYLNSLS